eukprot:TRINITY_DN12081_c0_g2_i2.p4 TRINITY_DN12081_c0_g2~~TRINITY_DN12081_c0_g2_i2.p4  ORF type:complete len:105 (+),score=42.92 TRINITY_DN12081_c0_g2_i2:87-401(+)
MCIRDSTNTAVLALSVLRAPLELSTIAAAVAAAATFANHLVVVPRALAAGRASMGERAREEDSKDLVDFAVDGGSQTKTKFWHQTVVTFVLVTTSALVVHVLVV